jgi:hypothetical protein
MIIQHDAAAGDGGDRWCALLLACKWVACILFEALQHGCLSGCDITYVL